MFKIFDSKKNTESQIIQNIIKNCLFDSAIIYRQKLSPLRGIKLVFTDGTSGILWSIDGNNYVFNFKAFDSIIKIYLTRDQGDEIWSKFLNTFESKYNLENV